MTGREKDGKRKLSWPREARYRQERTRDERCREEVDNVTEKVGARGANKCRNRGWAGG